MNVRSTVSSMIPAETKQLHWMVLVTATIISVLMCGFTCVIPDYLSLLKTRYAITRFISTGSKRIRAMIVIGDLICSLFFVVMSIGLLAMLMWFGTRSTVNAMLSPPAELKLDLLSF